MKIERAWWFAACFGMVAAQFIGCGEGGTKNPTPTGGGTSSSSGSGGGGGGEGGSAGAGGMSGSSSGMPPECVADTDCTNEGPVDFCGAPSCENGKCIRKGLQSPGMSLPSQTYGDCIKRQCDPTFTLVDVPDDTDVYDDANDCTNDVCTNGVLTHELKTTGTLCNGQAGVCTDTGACVQCFDGAAGCGMQTCVMNKCVPSTCLNGMKNAGEGDIDCGGSCVPCADGKTCTNGGQCASGVCMGGMCAAPTCTDTMKNGNETGYDCGGPECPKCPTDEACKLPSDCQNGVCISGFCVKPECNDAVQNGDEQGIDCGGTCMTTCP